MTKTIPKLIPARVAGSEQNIPRLLHQTFRSADVPEAMHRAAMSWSELNPGYSYHFYDDADHISFLRERFDPRVADAYGKINEGAFRADLWRYCILYEYGGVYADIDSVCKMPLDDVLRSNDEFVVPMVTAAQPSAVFNAFICSTPGHPFLREAITHACNNILSNKPFDGFSMVGPGALGMAINLGLGRSQNIAHRIGTFYDNGYTYRILQKYAGDGINPPTVADGNSVVLIPRYSGYFDDLADANVSHWSETDEFHWSKKQLAQNRYHRALKSIVKKLRG